MAYAELRTHEIAAGAVPAMGQVIEFVEDPPMATTSETPETAATIEPDPAPVEPAKPKGLPKWSIADLQKKGGKLRKVAR